MSYEVKVATQKVYCPVYLKEETVFIRYVLKDNKLILSFPNGCESGYHKSASCDACVLKCHEKFKSEF